MTMSKGTKLYINGHSRLLELHIVNVLWKNVYRSIPDDLMPLYGHVYTIDRPQPAE